MRRADAACALKCDVKSDNPIPSIESMRIYLKNSSAKFRPDPIWNDGTLGFLKRSSQQKDQAQDE